MSPAGLAAGGLRGLASVRLGMAAAGSMASAYVRSGVAGYRRRALFSQVETYCMFVGHARSGHTLVGSLLSAHPMVVIAHELDALRYVQWGFRRDQLHQLILEKDLAFSAKSHQQVKLGYRYDVPGEWQGRFSELRVIGDKKGGASTRKLGEHPELLGRLRRRVGVPVRLIQVTRNPFDNISTSARRSGRPLDDAIGRYFDRCATVQRIRDTGDPGELICLRYEDFVADTKGSLSQLCQFLGVEPSEGYLANCASVVREPSSRSRDDAPWTDQLVDRVSRESSRYGFLEGYSFES